MSYLPPSGIPLKDYKYAEIVVTNVMNSLVIQLNFIMSRYVPFGKSCVDASEDRGNYLAGILPITWCVDSYTYWSSLHTVNLIYFQASDGWTYCWTVDGYVSTAPVDIVQYQQRVSCPFRPVVKGFYRLSDQGTDGRHGNDQYFHRGRGFKLNVN